MITDLRIATGSEWEVLEVIGGREREPIRGTSSKELIDELKKLTLLWDRDEKGASNKSMQQMGQYHYSTSREMNKKLMLHGIGVERGQAKNQCNGRDRIVYNTSRERFLNDDCKRHL